MMLSEANERLKKEKITEDQLWKLNALYLLLDLDKNDFCKIVDAVGVDKLIAKQSRYDWLQKAEEELREKENYIAHTTRLAQIKAESEQLEKSIKAYQDKLDKLYRR